MGKSNHLSLPMDITYTRSDTIDTYTRSDREGENFVSVLKCEQNNAIKYTKERQK